MRSILRHVVIWSLGFVLFLLAHRSIAHGQEAGDEACVDCAYDESIDECALPGAECLADDEWDDATLEKAELALPDEDELPAVTGATVAEQLGGTRATESSALVCPEGASAQDGHCVDAPDTTAASHMLGGCSASARGVHGPLTVFALLLLLGLAAQRRVGWLRVVALLGLFGCVAGEDGWDSALADGPDAEAAGNFLDVESATARGGDQTRYLLAHQPIAASSWSEPATAFSLARRRIDGTVPIRHVDTGAACGERLQAGGAGELLGWAAPSPQYGTAALTEVLPPDGCQIAYETDAEALAQLEANGWVRGQVLGYVWPPGWGAAAAPAEEETRSVSATLTPTPCVLGKNPALTLFYTGTGVDDYRFLAGCPGEVVMGEKSEAAPNGRMKTAAAHAAGGRTAFVVADHGIKIRSMLLRTNGVERTAAYLRAKLKSGYDYLVIDEITADPNWRDGATVNQRFRKLLLRMPARTIIAYISLDLTMRPGGAEAMRARRLLLRALKLRGRALALEEYLHTGEVTAGAAPGVFRRAADQLFFAVRDLPGGNGINYHAITVLGLSMHTDYPQYNYLDRPSQDLLSIDRQATAILHASARLSHQHGIGFYFVGRSDVAPRAGAPYTIDALFARLHHESLRFR